MNKPVFYENLKETSKKAADIIAQSINKLLSTQEQVVLGIPGGRSVSRIFQKLKGKNIPWKKVHIFMIDDFVKQANSGETPDFSISRVIIKAINETKSMLGQL